MSVPGVTKCPRVQTFLVIGVAITLVTSYWRRLVLFPSCSVSSQQLGAINPALLLPPSYMEGRACGHSPKKLPLFTENPSRVLLGNRASGIRASRKPRGHKKRQGSSRLRPFLSKFCRHMHGAMP